MATEPERPSFGRAYLGLGILGWGLSILLQVAPHEDPLAGAGLAVFGAALLWSAPRWPAARGFPRWIPMALGLALVGLVVGYQAASANPWNLTKAALVIVGGLLTLSGFFLHHTLPVPGRKARMPVSTLALCAIPVLAVPLVTWGGQAVFKSLVGRTPIELFVMFFLLIPVSWVLAAWGWQPVLDGQTITYATPHGPLRVEVGAACSGVQAMALFAAVLGLFLIVERPGGRRLALWSIIGLAGVYVANLLRLLVLAIVGHQWGGPALQRAHEDAGWVFFVAWALAFAWLIRRFSPPAPRPSKAASTPRPPNVQLGRIPQQKGWGKPSPEGPPRGSTPVGPAPKPG